MLAITKQQTQEMQAANDEEILAFFFEQLDASESTQNTYKRNIKPFCLFIRSAGDTLTSATHATVNAYKKSLVSRGYKAATVNAYLSAVRALYKVLESNQIKANIAANIKNAKQSQTNAKDALTVQQTKLLLEQPKDGASVQELRDYALINLCARRGLRTIEISRANIEDIRNINGESVLFIQGKGHAAKDEFVILSVEVLQPINAYLAARGVDAGSDKTAPLFAGIGNRNAGGRLSTRAISNIIKAALKAHGLTSERLTAHSLRHTAVTLALLGGASLQNAQAMARHKNINTTLIYAHNLDRMNNGAEYNVDKLLA